MPSWHPGLSCFCLLKKKKNTNKHLRMRCQGRAAEPSANSLSSLDCLLSHPALQPLSRCNAIRTPNTNHQKNVYSTVHFASFHRALLSFSLSLSLIASLKGKCRTSGTSWTLTKEPVCSTSCHSSEQQPLITQALMNYWHNCWVSGTESKNHFK